MLTNVRIVNMGAVNEISNDIKARLDEIAEHLWMEPSHACLMVGAGMSKNAEKIDPYSRDALSWTDLTEKMQERILGISPVPEWGKYYTNILNVADQLEAVIKKGEMDRFLEQNIPDKELKPSRIHMDLLSLPWRDIFTTNYDTLLERTAELIIERKYELVVNKDKLVQSHSPRIIKLHGSFPANGPYIISEEDYRKYPQENATFVNTVQQALIENTLCLVGFSGDDPNFLKWIGWIRDNLQDNMQPIYLIDYLKLDVGKTLLLEKRNIIPIDLAEIGTDYAEALSVVLNYLKSKNSKVDEWGRKFYVDGAEKTPPHIVIERLKRQRFSYPGWMVIPSQVRESMNYTIRNLDLTVVKDADDCSKLSFLYEIVWLYRHVLRALYIQELPSWKTIVDKFNPFSTIFKVNGSEYNPENHQEWDWKCIGEQWIEVQLFILKTLREYGQESEWSALNELLEKAIPWFSPEQISQYQYELCLHYFYQFELDKLREQLHAWDGFAKSAKWQAKRAMLMAEFISLSEARKDLERTLLDIRKAQNLSPIKGNYSALSVEAYVLCALQRIKLAESVITKGKIEQSTETLTARMKQLKRYDCDPWGELRFFEYNLRPIDAIKPQEQVVPSFDLNRITMNHSFDDHKCVRLAIEYWQYLEETATFFRLPWLNILPKQATIDALSILRYARTYAAGIFQLRYGNADAVKISLTRKFMAYENQMLAAESMFLHYLKLMKLVTKRYDYKVRYQESFIEAAIATLPEMLSRLCCCVSFEVRKQLLDAIATAYTYRVRYVGMRALVGRLMNSFSEEEQESVLPELIKMPFPCGVIEHNLSSCDPIAYLRISKIHDSSASLKLVPVYSWLAFMDNDSDVRREIAIVRIQRLFSLGLLSDDQKELFAELLWKYTDEDGFPKGLSYYNFYYAKLPSPQGIDPIERLNKYIEITPFDPDKENWVSMQRGAIALWHNIQATQQLKQYRWTPKSLKKLAKDIIDWWQKHEPNIYTSKNVYARQAIMDEYRGRLKHIAGIISDILCPHWDELPRNLQDSLVQMTAKNAQYAKPLLYLSAVMCRTSEQLEFIEKCVCERMMIGDEEDIRDACDSVVYLHIYGKSIVNALNSICNSFAYNRAKNIGRSIIQFLTEFASEGYKFSLDNQKCILFGLNNCFNSILVGDEDSEIEAEEKLALQIECVRLAYYYKRNYVVENNDICILDKWIDITTKLDFCEIKNVITDIERKETEKCL